MFFSPVLTQSGGWRHNPKLSDGWPQNRMVKPFMSYNHHPPPLFYIGKGEKNIHVVKNNISTKKIILSPYIVIGGYG